MRIICNNINTSLCFRNKQPHIFLIPTNANNLTAKLYRIQQSSISNFIHSQKPRDRRTVHNPIHRVKMQPRNNIVVRVDHSEQLIVDVIAPIDQFEELQTAICQAHDHQLCRDIEQERCGFLRVVSGPELFKPVWFFLAWPVFHSSQWQNELSFFLVLPGEFCVRDHSIELFQPTVVSCCQHDVIVSVVHGYNYFAWVKKICTVIIFSIADFGLTIEFYCLNQNFVGVLAELEKLGVIVTVDDVIS